MEKLQGFYIRWYDSLQFKISFIFITLFLLIILSVTLILKTMGQRLIAEQAYLKISDANRQVIAELEKRTVLAATLANAMANLAEKLQPDENLHKELILQLMDYKGTEDFIAGGGIWPEAYQFSPDMERRSFFWGRDAYGTLQYYDSYNRPESPGYNREEWYVPAKYLPEGTVYWSKSYTDPYSYQPMVTVTVPMFKDGNHYGASTIDLKLEGLHELLHRVTRLFNGYAYVIDRNGTFLSFPDEKLARKTAQSVNQPSILPFITIDELAGRLSGFKGIADALNEEKTRLIELANHENNGYEKLAIKLAEESYQIQSDEARFIAAGITHTNEQNFNLLFPNINIFLNNDYFLHEPVYVSIYTMPNTYWHIITVMPYSVAIDKTKAMFNTLMLATLGAVLLAIAVIWLLTRKIFTTPISHLSQQLQHMLLGSKNASALISTSDKGELGALTHWFNLNTKQLLDSQKEIEHLVDYDQLTGLPNRRLLQERLKQILAIIKRRYCHGALLFIDLDNFKLINDSIGHTAGDELLVQVARRMEQSLRKEDTIARLGGDEFVVLIMSDEQHQEKIVHQASTVAEKLNGMMQEPFKLGIHAHHLTASIGIALFSSDEISTEEVLKQADTAMYQAKNKGPGNISFFIPEMQELAEKRFRIEKELRRAVKNNELCLAFQPQVNQEGICCGAEALIRWNHPERGMQSPGEFIDIAEESYIIISISEWVINEACRQIKEWNDAGYVLQEFAVNVSPKYFRQNEFINSLQQAIDRHHIRPQQLMIEITEGVVIEDITDTINKMNILKRMGIKISIDDFGTGYSSLTYLKSLPLNQLKIDQGFVRDITTDKSDAVIVTTIIDMAKHLGFDAIAEGVETDEQKKFLIENGCLHFQGYLFSKPLFADDFIEYLKHHQPH